MIRIQKEINTKIILILDDDERVCEELSEYLVRKRYRVFSAEKPSSAFHILNSNHIDILFLDYSLPEMNGIVVLQKIRELFPKLKVVMISGTANVKVVQEARQLGAVMFLNKPFLHREVQNALEC